MYIVDMTSQYLVVYLYILQAAIRTGMIDRVSSKGGIDVQGDTTKGDKGFSRLVHVLHILLLSQNWSTFRKGYENVDYFSSP
jgi:hypothetical protein